MIGPSEENDKKAGKDAPEVLSTESKMVLVVLIAAATIMILNETVLSTALPSIMEDFQIETSTAQWLTTGFLLTMAVVIPTTGYLLQRFSTRQIFTAALGVFLAGTLVAAIAPAFPVLLGGRVLQAAGTALVLPLLMTTAMTVVPPKRRGSIMGLISIVIAVAPALGPTLSGVILQHFTWHFLFWFMIPLVAIALIAGLKLVSNIGEQRVIPLDFISVVLSVIAFGGLVYALGSFEKALEQGNFVVLAVGVIGVIALIVFVMRQLKLVKEDRSLLDLRTFKVPSFRYSIIAMLVMFGLFIGLVTVIPILLQNALMAAPVVSGLAVMPGGLLQGLAAPFVGRIYDKVGPRPLLIPGSIIIFLGVTGMWWVSRDIHAWDGKEYFGVSGAVFVVAVLFAVLAIGLSLAMTPLMTTALGGLPQNLYGHGSAILNTLQQLAGATGTALLVAAMTFTLNSKQSAGEALSDATASGAASAFLLGMAFAALGILVSPLVKLDKPKVRTTHSSDPV